MENLVQVVAERLESLLGSDHRQKKFVLAVSGGADSMALLDISSELFPASQLAVAHFNHLTRGTASQLDENLVEKEAKRKGVVFFRSERLGEAISELALRNERLLFLSQVYEALGFDAIMTAHHADDQLETFLMRLLRGTGLGGLQAISESQGKWLRPFLHIPKERIRTYVNERGIEFREDESNDSAIYLRNRIRKNLVPGILELSKEFGGEQKFFERFQATLREISWTVDWVDAEISRRYGDLFTETAFWTRVRWLDWCVLGEQWQKLLLRRIFLQKTGEALARHQVDWISCAIREKTRSVAAPFGMRIHYSCEHLFFQTEAQKKQVAAARTIETDSNAVFLSQLGVKLTIDRTLLGDAECRFFQPGDFQGNRKLKELLLQQRIPKLERSILPLVARPSSHEVLWFFPQQIKSVSVQSVAFPFTFMS